MANSPEATLRTLPEPGARQSGAMDELVRQAVFGAPRSGTGALADLRRSGRRPTFGPRRFTSPICARRGEVRPFTTPAMNIRVLSYDSAAPFFRAASASRWARSSLAEIARLRDRLHRAAPAE